MNTDISPYTQDALSIKVEHYYRHYKGGIYKVLVLARVEGVLDEVVVYQSVIDPELTWTRPVHSFLDEVEHDGATLPRFAYLGSESEYAL